MSKYTTEVRFICEQAAGLTESAGYDRIDSILDSARGKVFDFDFPIFDESYRIPLENKILKHYYTREIGAESVGLWKHWLCTRLNEIMPYYNQMYASAVLEFNPFYDVDLTTNSQRVNNGNRDTTGSFSENNSSNSTTNTDYSEAKKNDHWDYYSNTPEGGINGLESNTYLTDARHVTDDTTGSTTDTDTSVETAGERAGEDSRNEIIRNTEDYLHHIVGKNGGVSYSKLLKEYRETFVNIDMMIVKDLRDLFMNVW